ncbi:MAG: tRNA pseudouridine(38-40) synthase TruA [Coriobacteriia bacterium]|nr:tRNA pseudouridine(38-40) synthase TruA [Coriobacteriia bacterium]
MASTIVLTVSYDGRGFAGFARQPGLVTVQGQLESALATALRRDVETVGAGRTDAGVHALEQVVSLEWDEPDLDRAALLRSLNALVGDGIVVTGVREAPAGFSARHSAVGREYRYRIVPGPVPPLFLAPVSWWVKGTLDLGAMREAADALIGEHDFRSFCVASSAEGIRTFRRLDLIEIGPEIAMGEHSIVIRVAGNAFLHSMVRVIVGSLAEVGLGRRPASWVADALAACDRSAAGPTAPAQGLTLWHVHYPEECWL